MIFPTLPGRATDNSFYGTVTYPDGKPAYKTMPVTVYRGGKRVGDGMVDDGGNGCYNVGPDAGESFVTGYYILFAADSIGIQGQKGCHHEEGTWTRCDIVLNQWAIEKEE